MKVSVPSSPAATSRAARPPTARASVADGQALIGRADRPQRSKDFIRPGQVLRLVLRHRR